MRHLCLTGVLMVAGSGLAAMPMQCSGERISYSTINATNAIADLVTVIIGEVSDGSVPVEVIEWVRPSDGRDFQTIGRRRVRSCAVDGSVVTCAPPRSDTAEGDEPARYREAPLELEYDNGAISLTWTTQAPGGEILFYGLLSCIGRSGL